MAAITVTKNQFKFTLDLREFDTETGATISDGTDETRTITIDLPNNYTPSSATTTLQAAFVNNYMTNFANKQSSDGTYLGSLVQVSNWKDYDDNERQELTSYPLLKCESISSALVQETTTYFDNN